MYVCKLSCYWAPCVNYAGQCATCVLTRSTSHVLSYIVQSCQPISRMPTLKTVLGVLPYRDTDEMLALFPGLRAAFGCTKERKGPGMFPHVRDVEGRKVVERT